MLHLYSFFPWLLLLVCYLSYEFLKLVSLLGKWYPWYFFVGLQLDGWFNVIDIKMLELLITISLGFTLFDGFFYIEPSIVQVVSFILYIWKVLCSEIFLSHSSCQAVGVLQVKFQIDVVCCYSGCRFWN
jgi:hypothetical protein